MRILAVDYGLKRIGLAITSKAVAMALPFKTIEHTGTIPKAVRLLKQTIEELGDISCIVLGWPLYLDSNPSPLCKEVEKLKIELEKLNIPVELMDERFTTKIMEESYRSHGYSRKDRKAHIDQAAAVLLLNSYIEKKERENRNIL